MTTFDLYVSEGDQRPSIPDTLTDANGVVVNLTTPSPVTGVKFYARQMGNDDDAIAGEDAVITVPLGGQVRYDLTPADVLALEPGIYGCYWRVTFADSTTQRHPNAGKLLLQVDGS